MMQVPEKIKETLRVEWMCQFWWTWNYAAWGQRGFSLLWHKKQTESCWIPTTKELWRCFHYSPCSRSLHWAHCVSFYSSSYLFHSVFPQSSKPSDKHVTDCALCFCDLQYGMGSSGGSKSSFTPFVDPRVYGTSPTDDDDNISASGTFSHSVVPGSPKVITRWIWRVLRQLAREKQNSATHD